MGADGVGTAVASGSNPRRRERRLTRSSPESEAVLVRGGRVLLSLSEESVCVSPRQPVAKTSRANAIAGSGLTINLATVIGTPLTSVERCLFNGATGGYYRIGGAAFNPNWHSPRQLKPSSVLTTGQHSARAYKTDNPATGPPSAQFVSCGNVFFLAPRGVQSIFWKGLLTIWRNRTVGFA